LFAFGGTYCVRNRDNKENHHSKYKTGELNVTKKLHIKTGREVKDSKVQNNQPITINQITM
jgi:hypothetical protein